MFQTAICKFFTVALQAQSEPSQCSLREIRYMCRLIRKKHCGRCVVKPKDILDVYLCVYIYIYVSIYTYICLCTHINASI